MGHLLSQRKGSQLGTSFCPLRFIHFKCTFIFNLKKLKILPSEYMHGRIHFCGCAEKHVQGRWLRARGRARADKPAWPFPAGQPSPGGLIGLVRVQRLLCSWWELFLISSRLPCSALVCDFRKDRDVLEERVRSQNLEREQEQIDRIVRESGGKLTRRLVNSQVMQCFLPPRGAPCRPSA